MVSGTAVPLPDKKIVARGLENQLVKLGKDLGKKARERCVKEYSWETLKEQTLKVYYETMNA